MQHCSIYTLWWRAGSVAAGSYLWGYHCDITASLKKAHTPSQDMSPEPRNPGGINISAGLSDELCQTVVFFQALETSSRFTSFRHLPGCKKYVDVALRDMA